VINSRLRLGLACVAAVFGFAQAQAQSPTPAKTVTIFAAASLQSALDAVAAAYKAESGAEARISYAASLTLARQIEAGAPADVFISADAASMDYLAARQLIDASSRFDLLGNSLVVVAPLSSRLQQIALTKDALSSAIGEGRVAMGDPASVPAGKYAKAALEQLGLWKTVEPHLAFTDTVRAALVFVAREEAPLGIVYATDARGEPRVKTVAAFPDSSHPRIIYPATATAGGGEAGKRFLAFLKTPMAKTAFEAQGFVLLAH
jgi:molybdate transport system substrate-binding protein